MQTDVLIVGGGLSGLYLAYKLSRSRRDFLLVEARERLGGRIYAHNISFAGQSSTASYDLGPAWIWPQLQPLMEQLLDELGLKIFPQFCQGAMLYEQPGVVQQTTGQSAQGQSFRIQHGNTRLIAALRQRLDDKMVWLQSRANAVRVSNKTVQVDVLNDLQQRTTIHAERLVLALPPRLIAEHIPIEGIDANVVDQWRHTPTWMAGQAKILFIYAQPFWRELGFSGEVFSQRGPLTEIYDASPERGGPYALFGFIGMPADRRESLGQQQLIAACQAQIKNLFPGVVPAAQQVIYKDWAQDAFTATAHDKMVLRQHPDYARLNQQKTFFDDRLLLSGSEMAPVSGGYLEGALEAAEAALTIINATTLN